MKFYSIVSVALVKAIIGRAPSHAEFMTILCFFCLFSLCKIKNNSGKINVMIIL